MSSTTRSTDAGASGIRQLCDEVADHDAPVLGHAAEEGLDVRPRDVGELRAALERDQATVVADRADQRERQSARPHSGFDDDTARKHIGLGDDLRGILRVDDRGAPRHRHDEVAQQGTQRQVLVPAAVGDDRAVGLADQCGVPQHAVVRVQFAVLAERDRVHAVLRTGELNAIADPERAAGALDGHGFSPRPRG